MTVKEKVAKGVALLTEKYGDKWRAKVDLKELDMSGLYSCILGQTDNDYSSHLKQLGNPNSIEHGFDVDNGEIGFVDKAYTALEREWKRVLKEKP